MSQKTLASYYSHYFNNSSIVAAAMVYFENLEPVTVRVAGKEHTSSFIKDLDKFERSIRTKINQAKRERRLADMSVYNGRYYTQPVTSCLPLCEDLEFCSSLFVSWNKLERWAEDEDNEGVAYLDMDSRHPYTKELKRHITYLKLKGDYSNAKI